MRCDTWVCRRCVASGSESSWRLRSMVKAPRWKADCTDFAVIYSQTRSLKNTNCRKQGTEVRGQRPVDPKQIGNARRPSSGGKSHRAGVTSSDESITIFFLH